MVEAHGQKSPPSQTLDSRVLQATENWAGLGNEARTVIGYT